MLAEEKGWRFSALASVPRHGLVLTTAGFLTLVLGVPCHFEGDSSTEEPSTPDAYACIAVLEFPSLKASLQEGDALIIDLIPPRSDPPSSHRASIPHSSLYPFVSSVSRISSLPPNPRVSETETCGRKQTARVSSTFACRWKRETP